MFDAALIQARLKGLVGFRQPANPAFAIIDADNLISMSGLYVNDNPHAKIEFLKNTADYSKMTNPQFNDFLRNIKKSSIVNICNQVFNQPDFIDRNLIYTQPNNKQEEFALPAGFKGYRIEVSDKKNVAIIINRIIGEYTTGEVKNLLVFNSNKKQPLETIPVTCDEYYGVAEVNVTLRNEDHYKGTYYIGFIDELTTYKRNFESANYANKFTFLEIDTVVVEGHATEELFDLNDVKQVSDYCGFNLDLTVVDDFTDFILNNYYLFSRAIYLDTIISCLNIYGTSLRSNADERTTEEIYLRVMLEIDGTRPDDNVLHIKGLRPQMMYEISQIREQLLKLREGFFGKGVFVDTQT